jgi:Undecaprenyl-phosphate glucose phosphotransferase
MSTRPRLKEAASRAVVTSNDLLPPAASYSTPLSTFLGYMLASEFFTVAASAYIASVFYYHFVFGTFPPLEQYVPATLFIATLYMIVSIGFHHFVFTKRQRLDIFLWNAIGAVALAFSFFQTTIFLLKISETYSRGTFISQLIGVTIAILIVRTITHSMLQSAISSGVIKAPRVILIGDKVNCERFAQRVDQGAVDIVHSTPFPTADRSLAEAKNGGRDIGPSHSLIERFRALRPDYFIILPTPERYAAISQLANILSELPISLHIVPVLDGDFLRSVRHSELAGVPTMQILQAPLSKFDEIAKRAVDIILASLILIMFAPLLLVTALWIKLEARGPVIFRQTRHGYNNEIIRIFKFRTMTTCDSDGQFVQATKDDPRITRLGRVLRSTNIDELPQLFNVLLGEMSMIGPRPHPVALNEAYVNLISLYSRRHNVKPGITGWAQVNGYRGETDTIEKMQRRLQYDIYYIDNWSFMFDLKIIVLTLFSRKAYMNAH